MLRRLLWLIPLLASGAVALAQQNTGWLNPSAHSGTFTNPTRAFANDTLSATTAHGQEHRYWGYGISIPSGHEVVGIEVLMDARRHVSGIAATLHVELSWDGGGSWTTTGYNTGAMPTTWVQYVRGGAADTWGRTWTTGELAAGVFRVRLRSVQAARLDWIAVRVHFRSVTLALTVSPQLVDLGTLTLADYDAGFREIATTQRITVSSPASWTLHVAANAATWVYTGSVTPPPAKPSSHLEWRVSASGPGITTPQTSFLGLTTLLHRVAGGAAGTGLWLDIALRLLVDYDTTVPGTYTLSFTYTLTAP